MRSQFSKVASGQTSEFPDFQDNYFAKVNKQSGRTHIVIQTYRQPNLIEPQLHLFDLKGQHLQNIYNDEPEEFKKSYNGLSHMTVNINHFQLDVILSFFLAVHLGRLEIASFLFDKEDIVKKLVMKLTFSKQEIEQRNLPLDPHSGNQRKAPKRHHLSHTEQKDSEDGLEGELDDDLEDSFKEEIRAKNSGGYKRKGPGALDDELISQKSGADDEDAGDFSRGIGTSNKIHPSLSKELTSRGGLSGSRVDVEAAVQAMKKIETSEQVKMIKELMMKKGAKIAMNVLKIALNKEEEKLASIIVAHYPVHIDPDMLNRAIRKDMYDFLQTVWGYGKNVFVDQVPNDIDLKQMDMKQKIEKVTMTMLFEKILTLTDEKPGVKIRQVVKWKYQHEKDSMLQALLAKQQDYIAIEALNDYYAEVKKELYLFALSNQNEEFISYCLKNGVFGKEILNEPEVVEQSMKLVYEGRKTLFLLKCFAFYDFNGWSKKQIRDFMNLAQALYKTAYEKNTILLSYNPLMQLSLCAQYCQKIGKKQKAFQLKCERIVSKLLELCVTVIERIDDEKLFENYFMQTDFKQRSMFNIISMNKFNKLMLDEKISNLLTKIWDGEDVKQCDGRYKDFSILAHLLVTPARKVPGRNQGGPFTIFQNNFNFHSENSQWWFQFEFRRKSISFFYLKEVLLALGILLIYQYINFLYLDLFQNKNFRDKTTSQQQENLSTYKNWNVLAFFISGSLIFSVFLKFIFNLVAKRKLRCDIWTFLDMLCAFVNLVAVNVVSNFSVSELLNTERKQSIDYYIILVMAMSWIRFFSYLLVNRHISPLLNTLFRMIIDTFYFLVILLSYMAIMSSVFETLFIDVDNSNFGTFIISFRSLFSAMMGDFSYDNAQGRETSFSVFMIIHLFISSILLLNYLIAILSTVYEVMRDFGDFSFKAGLYSYCERYLIPFDDPRFGQLVVHPAPICLFSLILLPYICTPNTLRKVSVCYSMVMFWIQNIIMVVVFFVLELLILIVIYFKMFRNIVKSADRCLMRFLTILLWIPAGPFILLFYILRDIIRFSKLLCKMSEAEEEKQEKKQDEDKRQDTIVISNELILAMRKSFMSLSLAYKYKDEEATRKLRLKKGGGRVADHASPQDERNLHQKVEEEMQKIEDKALQELELDLEQHQNKSFFVSKRVIIKEWIRVRPDSESQPNTKKGEDMPSGLSFRKSPSPTSQVDQAVLGLDKLNTEYRDFSETMLKGMKEEETKGNPNEEGPNSVRERRSNSQNQRMKAVNDLVFMALRNISKDKHKTNETMSEVGTEFSDVDNIANDDREDDMWKMLEAMNIEIPRDEVEIVKHLLSRFSMTSEQSSSEQIDLRLTLMALPHQINETNFSRVELFNFKLVQESLIDFQHQEVVDLFQYYDNRHRSRFTKIMGKVQKHSKEMRDIRKQLIARQKAKKQIQDS